MSAPKLSLPKLGGGGKKEAPAPKKKKSKASKASSGGGSNLPLVLLVLFSPPVVQGFTFSTMALSPSKPPTSKRAARVVARLEILSHVRFYC